MTQTEATIKLGATWNCKTCGDWFHMPYKYCKCDRKKQ